MPGMRDARFIPLLPESSVPGVMLPATSALPEPQAPTSVMAAPVLDQLHRPLHDLRISVTDRCNFRCSYCMPRTVYGPGHRFLPQPSLLTFEEIERSSRLFVELGVRKLRLTGGEPLMRKQLDRLVAALAPLQGSDGEPIELTLTTNASLLATQAAALKAAGLHRVTISLDALDDPVFQRMNDAGVSVATVLKGIEAAQRVGLGPIKINMVVQRGVNEQQILPMARHFRHSGAELRFIEYMDVGSTNGWQRQQVLPSDEVRSLIHAHFPLHALPMRQSGETARRFAYDDGAGTIGFISSVTQAFCGDCNRLRLSTDGQLYTCLFARHGHDLRGALRSNASDETLRGQLRALWHQRADQYSQQRGQATRSAQDESRVEMSYIGG
jgi:cyclic pyranopterin phosphate synthase